LRRFRFAKLRRFDFAFRLLLLPQCRRRRAGRVPPVIGWPTPTHGGLDPHPTRWKPLLKIYRTKNPEGPGPGAASTRAVQGDLAQNSAAGGGPPA